MAYKLNSNLIKINLFNVVSIKLLPEIIFISNIKIKQLTTIKLKNYSLEKCLFISCKKCYKYCITLPKIISINVSNKNDHIPFWNQEIILFNKNINILQKVLDLDLMRSKLLYDTSHRVLKLI